MSSVETTSAFIPSLTDRGHFQFGYQRTDGFHPYSMRSSPSDTWTVRYGRANRYPMTFREECLETARTIRRSTAEPITVLFSGGVDSEVALRSFSEAGIPVTAAILRFEDDLNLHDYAWAIITCEELQIPYRLYDLNLRHFWTSDEAMKLAEATRCVSPQILATMWLIDRCEGFCVLGSGENHLVKQTNDAWHLVEKEKVAAWYRHFIKRERQGCAGFFQYTPELMLAWMLDPFARALWTNPQSPEVDSKFLKFRIYQQHFHLRERPKQTGFEKVLAEDILLRRTLETMFADSDAHFSVSALELVRGLWPDLKTFRESSFTGEPS